MVDHRCARTRRTDDGFRFALLKHAYETLCQPARFRTIPGVKGWLPAAGLPFIKLNLTADSPKDFDRAGADLAPKLVHETGNE
jgi:hypothetical protein